MRRRACFGLIAIFWVTMNVLLWRVEFAGSGETGSTVPIELVWRKILTAPDDSSLEITRAGEKIGYCRWLANLGEELKTGRTADEEAIPSELNAELREYSVDLEGNILLENAGGRVRFDLHGAFATNHVWRELSARLAIRPSSWAIQALAAEQTLTVKFEDNESKWDRTFQFAQLRDPQKLLGEFGTPWVMALLSLPGSAGVPAGKPLSLGLNWEARNDWIRIGHTQVRVYRLRVRLWDKYQAVVIVSRVGEILRVDLPDNIRMVNEALLSL